MAYRTVTRMVLNVGSGGEEVQELTAWSFDGVSPGRMTMAANMLKYNIEWRRGLVGDANSRAYGREDFARMGIEMPGQDDAQGELVK